MEKKIEQVPCIVVEPADDSEFGGLMLSSKF